MNLTKRQTEIVERLAVGSTCEEIAAEFNRSSLTVRTQVKQACERLNAKNIANLVAISISHELIKVALCFALVISGINNDAEALRHRQPTRTRQQVSASRTLARRDVGSIYT